MSARLRKIVLHRAPIVAGFLGLAVCGPNATKDKPVLGAELTEEQHQVLLVLRNFSVTEFYICKKNVYDAIGSLTFRCYPDTAELPPEKVYDRRMMPGGRTLITVSDYIILSPGKDVKLPVDLRGIRYDRALGDSAFIAVSFKNIDPFSCSKVEVNDFDKATLDYCKRLHFIPAQSCVYWSGEVRTPYYLIHLRKYIRPPPPAAPKARAVSREIVVRKSKTHPLEKKVF